MKQIFSLTLFYFFFINANLAADDSTFYDLKITIHGLKTPKALLGYHFGEQTFAVDSAVVDTSTGAFRFTRNRRLPEGVYFVATTEGGILFDFIVAGWKDFSITTDLAAVYDSANISRSDENIVFFNYMKTAKRTRTEIGQMQSTLELLQKATKDRSVLAEQEQKILEKYKSLDTYTKQQIEQNPTLFVTKLLKTTRQMPLPADIKPFLLNRQPNPTYNYVYRRQFFENVDFSDERLLRSPFYVARLQQFFLRTIPPQADSVKSYMDFLLEKTRAANPDFYQFTLRWLTELFDTNLDNIVNADAFLVHLVEKYHHAADAKTDKYALERLDYKAKAFKPNLIGSLAPPILLPDTEGSKKSLADVQADFTLLVFYSSLCTHCQAAMPKISDATQFTEPSKLKIFTICTDGERAPWLAFLEKNKMKNWVNVLDEKPDSDIQKNYATWNLPVIYLLDKDKRIVAKRLKAENLPDLLRVLFSEKK